LLAAEIDYVESPPPAICGRALCRDTAKLRQRPLVGQPAAARLTKILILLAV
jgi:hypothetical protein